MMTKFNPLPPVDLVREWLDYDPDTGIFRWKTSRSRVKAGDVAGCRTTYGYISISVKKQACLAHRLAWLYMTGEDPDPLQVDHINLNRSDNRFSNLRLTGDSGNKWNSARRRDNISGIKGVSWHKATGKWQAHISVNGKNTYLGLFANRTEARRAIAKARKELHGDFARHN